MMTETLGICETCRELKPTAYRDPIGREYCKDHLPVPTVTRALGYLLATIPFGVGDRVEARTAGVLLDGVGVIDQISVEPENFGTPAHPAFHVVIEEKAYPEAPNALWYMEKQLRKVGTVSNKKSESEGLKSSDYPEA